MRQQMNFFRNELLSWTLKWTLKCKKACEMNFKMNETLSETLICIYFENCFQKWTYMQWNETL